MYDRAFSLVFSAASVSHTTVPIFNAASTQKASITKQSQSVISFRGQTCGPTRDRRRAEKQRRGKTSTTLLLIVWNYTVKAMPASHAPHSHVWLCSCLSFSHVLLFVSRAGYHCSLPDPRLYCDSRIELAYIVALATVFRLP